MDNLDYLEAIYDIEQRCFAQPWSKSGVHSALAVSFCVLSLKYVDNELAGCALGARLGDECELYRIAVLPEHRRKGLGRELLLDFIDKSKTAIFLETASRNTAAIELYKSVGFVETGRRKDYYRDEDGYDDGINFRYEHK